MSDPFKGFTPPKERKTSYSFKAPTKEEATTGRWMNAGDNYGVGYKCPTGKEKARSLKAGSIPQESKCVDPNEIF